MGRGRSELDRCLCDPDLQTGWINGSSPAAETEKKVLKKVEYTVSKINEVAIARILKPTLAGNCLSEKEKKIVFIIKVYV